MNRVAVPGRAALLGGTCLVVTGCALAAEAEAEAPAAGFTACAVPAGESAPGSGPGAAVLAGMRSAEHSGGIEVARYEPRTPADFEPGLTAMVQAGCDLTVAAGPALAEATGTVAAAHPEADFVVVGGAPADLPNVKPVVSDTADAAFLAGYAAAGASRTGTVAAYGHRDVPAGTAVLTGFAEGVAHYNRVAGRDVELLGWDRRSGEGVLLDGSADTAAARAATQDFLDAGADVVLSAAGPAAQGTVEAVAAANAAGHEAWFVPVGVGGDAGPGRGDQHRLTAVLERVDTAVRRVVEDAAAGGFDSAPHIGTLANGGVGLAPFPARTGAVGEDLAAEVRQLEQDVVDGTVVVGGEASSPPAAPRRPDVEGVAR